LKSKPDAEIGKKGGVSAPVRIFDYVMGCIKKLFGFGRVPDDA